MLLAVLLIGAMLLLHLAYSPFRPAASVTLATRLPSPPPLPLLHATAFLIAVDGAPLAGSRTGTPHPTASTVKLLTALVAVHDPMLPPDRVITVSAAQVRRTDASYAQGDSVLPLTVGEHLTVHDLLLALLLPSGDNAADMLAAAGTGGRSGFLAAMGRESERLGLGSAVFGDPSGLSAQDQLSPLGAVRLAEAALANPTVRAIVRMRFARLSTGQVVHNLNQLLWSYSGAIGMKTGFTPKAGYMLVFAARRHGRTAIGSVMGEPDFPAVFSDATRLLDWAFSAAPSRTLPAGLAVGLLRWPNGARQQVRLAHQVTIPWAFGGSPTFHLSLAPPSRLAAGGDGGALRIAVRGRWVIRVPVATTPMDAWVRLLARVFP